MPEVDAQPRQNEYMEVVQAYAESELGIEEPKVKFVTDKMAYLVQDFEDEERRFLKDEIEDNGLVENFVEELGRNEDFLMKRWFLWTSDVFWLPYDEIERGEYYVVDMTESIFMLGNRSGELYFIDEDGSLLRESFLDFEDKIQLNNTGDSRGKVVAKLDAWISIERKRKTRGRTISAKDVRKESERRTVTGGVTRDTEEEKIERPSPTKNTINVGGKRITVSTDNINSRLMAYVEHYGFDVVVRACEYENINPTKRRITRREIKIIAGTSLSIERGEI